MTEPASPRLCVGRIMGVHGIRGELRVLSHTADPLSIADYGPLLLADGRVLRLRKVRLASKGVVAVAHGITDRTAAEALVGQDLFLPRAALPEPDDEDDYYHADLIGLVATDPDGVPCGTVMAVHDFGAGDLLEIQPPEGENLLIPFTREAVPEVSLATGTLRLNPAFMIKNK